MVIIPYPRQTTARVLHKWYCPTRVFPQKTDMDDEGVVQETVSCKEPENVDSGITHP